MKKHHGTFLSLLLAILLIAAGCQNSTKGGGGSDDQDNFSSGNTDFDQEADPSEIISDLGDQVDEMGESDPENADAYTAGGSALDKLAQAWQGVKPGASLNEVLQWFALMSQNQNAIQQAANLAQQRQITWLYLALMRFLQKTPVWRIYKAGQHIQTIDKNEISVLKSQGWTYEGLSFFVWKENTPQAISLVPTAGRLTFHECKAAGNPRDRFISIAANCKEGQHQHTLVRKMGYASNVKNNLAPLKAVRLYHPWGDHITTLEVPNDPNDEPSFAVTVGYRLEGPQGYPPL